MTDRDLMHQALGALEKSLPRLAPYGEQDWLDSKEAIDALHLAAMDLARKQAQRIAELEAEVERFRQHAMNEKAARQALEQQLEAQQPKATYQRIGTLYSNSWPMAASGWGFVPSGMKCGMAGYIFEKPVFVLEEK